MPTTSGQDPIQLPAVLTRRHPTAIMRCRVLSMSRLFRRGSNGMVDGGSPLVSRVSSRVRSHPGSRSHGRIPGLGTTMQERVLTHRHSHCDVQIARLWSHAAFHHSLASSMRGVSAALNSAKRSESLIASVLSQEILGSVHISFTLLSTIQATHCPR